MKRHKPALLGAVDGLEIIEIGGEYQPRQDRQDRLVRQWVPKYTTLNAPEPLAKRIAKLWRNLPVGVKAKCYSPAFRLRFFAEESLLVDASVCWHCNTICILEDGEGDYIGFDASAPASQELLKLLIEAFSDSFAV